MYILILVHCIFLSPLAISRQVHTNRRFRAGSTNRTITWYTTKIFTNSTIDPGTRLAFPSRGADAALPVGGILRSGPEEPRIAAGISVQFGDATKPDEKRWATAGRIEFFRLICEYAVQQDHRGYADNDQTIWSGQVGIVFMSLLYILCILALPVENIHEIELSAGSNSMRTEWIWSKANQNRRPQRQLARMHSAASTSIRRAMRNWEPMSLWKCNFSTKIGWEFLSVGMGTKLHADHPIRLSYFRSKWCTNNWSCYTMPFLHIFRATPLRWREQLNNLM